MILLKTAVVVTPHCWGGDSVAAGASLVIFTAEQGLVTLLYSVGADSALHTTTHFLHEGTFHPDTATFRAKIRRVISKEAAVLVGVITACGAPLPLLTIVLTLDSFVGR